MSNDSRATIPTMDGVVAYPRKNGEPVFDAPWQSRAFGMVVNLHTQGAYPWDEFKQRLIQHVAQGDRAAACAAAPAANPGYYDQWVAAFCDLLIDKHLISPDEMDQRVNDFKTGVRQQVY
ncbi:nitrile hydratase accessory protein [Pseudomonas typographi]|uniref:Nitrile hydratase accessory protein n=1 Tax=Pseudomonas typographi TaxID=2715964 RepID=A0ABR7YZV3_9PSED|nr:nitrile hydratase accessory protein [Pseudomonas typographi]MBD1550550.1 nitrile hydratase accessory protein [Pseudomonas typographi]MBD1586863.1 nitrile hydratase accessory protein [Pseudomonas typographi]MBD1598759.1 nitrile hydratase accessory protein [Pseudomonas typographi]